MRDNFFLSPQSSGRQNQKHNWIEESNLLGVLWIKVSLQDTGSVHSAQLSTAMGPDKVMHFKKNACDRHCPKEWSKDDQNPCKCNLHENLDWDDFISRRKKVDISKDFKFEKALCREVGKSLCFKSMMEQQKVTKGTTDLHWNQGDSGETSVKSS